MKGRNDYSPLFRNKEQTQDFSSSIKPDTEMVKALGAAEHALKDHLRKCVSDALARWLPASDVAGQPKFLRQGSLPHGLLVDPLRLSDNFNEGDADLGMYVPLEYVQQAQLQPTVAARDLLSAVKECLEVFCSRRGWDVERKTCCFRIRIRPDAHLDLTIYATPRSEFVKMAAMSGRNYRLTLDEQAQDDITWDDLPRNKSLLATDDGWQRSNARAINERISTAHALNGCDFRDATKHQKAHRDFMDRTLCLPSVAITLIVIDEIDNALAVSNRLDLQALHLFERMSLRVTEPLPTPGNEDLDILGCLTEAERESLAMQYRNTTATLREAIFNDDFDRGNAKLRQIFGSRFPLQSAPDTRSKTSTSSSASGGVVPKSAPAIIPHGSIGSA